jgi:spore germination protein GerM
MSVTKTQQNPAEPATHTRRVVAWVVVVLLVLAGWGARSAAVDGSENALISWLPWMQRTSITLYFTDPTVDGLVPISRLMPASDTPAEEIVAELLKGPKEGLGLVALIPPDTVLRSATLQNGLLSVNLSGDPARFRSPDVAESIRLSLTSWSAVEEVDFKVNGRPVDLSSNTSHRLFYWNPSRDMLVAQPAAATDPREVLVEYLAGSSDPDLFGLPSDIQIVGFDLNAQNGLLTLDFTFLPSLRTFALDNPEGMRRVLEGLIATMTTTFPEVDGVYLDFEGQAMLGLGHCADLLRSLQLPPDVLNDERLLVRSSA